MKKRVAILISGHGSNMEAIIKNSKNGILKDHCEVVLILSNRENAEGLQIASSYGIETTCIISKGKKREDYDLELVSFLKQYELDYIVLAGFMRILSSAFIKTFKNRIINIHPADTDKFKGLGAYEWAFKNKLYSTKITVHFVDNGVDTGKVIGKCNVDLKGAKTLSEVKNRGLKVEHKFYSEMLEKVFNEK
ncbi:MAG: phosphoribosylglycinamide formyltransferase [Candidatus Marinimicrobia bacterium]|jgi:phosphoribosylglycinamide formyltransferase-1|nr:phosphoribosylglycinamide formyltransferase [Candidatus Neomarinimicrobiota bacterium]